MSTLYLIKKQRIDQKMASLTLFMSFAILCLSSFLFSFTTAAGPIYLNHFCSDNNNFTSNGTYQTNLNRVLSSLSSAANGSNGFHNASSGQDPNSVYGLFQCRGDLSTDVCQACVTYAAGEVNQRCPVAKGVVIWYNECLLRYSDDYIFSTMAVRPSFGLMNTINVTEPERFSELLASLMSSATTDAANSPQRYATRTGNFTASQNVYCLVQCTQDLSSSDCTRCLQTSIVNLPGGKVGGRRIYPSCHSMYEMYPFYNEASPPAPPPITGSPPPAPVIRPKEKKRISSSIIIAIVAPIAGAVVLFVAGFCFLTRRERKKKKNSRQEEIAGKDISAEESLQFDFEKIRASTNGFSANNKLGEGGFGEVYKGVLADGQEIAVKRMSRSSGRSGQGAAEFKNEVLLLAAKLQHRNLVRLLGFCLEGEEKIIVYEFVPNKSLDQFLCDPERKGQLDWSRRYKIIRGIAWGILYLHEDSRLRIIHRDLKAKNILLDGNMNPKISDFGMARILRVDQTQGNTERIVGTYGYMAPEYITHGQFSVKLDVYSFGVLVLEIITGKKYSNFYQTNGDTDLLSYAWKHWRDGTPMQLLDSNLTDSYSRNEVIRCIHVALLCVQEDQADRPTMATIVLMLNSYSVTLPLPQQPAFFMPSRTYPDPNQSTSKSIQYSVDDASITEEYPR